MLSETDKYKLSLYEVKEKLHISKDCIIYLTQSSISNKLYIKRVYENSNMLELFNTIKDKKVRNTPEIIEAFYDGKDTIVIEEYILAHTAEEVALTKSLLYKIINQILLSVEDLHSINIIHRDIKPSNILVTKDYKAYLIDFGIARFHSDTLDTDTTQSGTKGFASPEQYGFQQTDFRSDIYSIGKTIEALIKSNNINCSLKKVISKSISFDPKDRYCSVAELKGAINKNKLYVFVALIFIVILIIVFICLSISKKSETYSNKENLISDGINGTETTSEITSELISKTATVAETTTQIIETTTSAPIVKPKAEKKPTSKPQSQTTIKTNNNNTSQKTSDSKPTNTNINILSYNPDEYYFEGLIVPDGIPFMEVLGSESSKTCSIEIDNTKVTVQCIKNNSTLNVNLSDALGHSGSLSMSFSEEQIKNCDYPNYHSFNAYIFFFDFNNDGNTEIFVNFTDYAMPLNKLGEPFFIGSTPHVLRNWNSLRLAEYNSSNGFYVYKEVMETQQIYKFKVGGNLTSGIYCDEYFSTFIPHDGVITEKPYI